MTAPCAIEYILVTRWRGGKKGGQNRVCACDTRDRGVKKKLKPEHPSETVVMPESGERKRNLTTLVLVKNAAVKRSRSRQKVLESSQNPLSSSRRRERARQGRSNVQRSSNDEAFSQRFLELVQLRYHVKTTLERCGPFSLVVLSQRRSQVTPLSGHSDQNASETFSNKLQLNKVQSSLRQTSAKTTQVRSKAKTS